MRTYICSEILTQLSLLTLITLITKNKVLSKSTKSKLIATSVLIMVCALAEFIGVLYDRGMAASLLLHRLAKYLELCLTPIVPIVLATVFPAIRAKKFFLIPSAIHIVLETLSLFFGFVFYVDDTNVYHHGKFYWLYFLIISFNILYLSFATVKFSIRLQNRNHISLLVIIGFVLTGTIFQAIDSTVKVVWLTVAIGVILFYIYYCNMVYQLDSLTALLGRRAYETHKSLLKKRTYIIFFDINNFKSINDSFGHDVGDSCLKCVAAAMRETYGKNGLCYRIGGDEFCVIIDRKTHSCNIEKQNEKFNRLLSAKSCSNGTILSVAIGYAIYKPGETTVDSAIKEADGQMYRNKNKSRHKE